MVEGLVLGTSLLLTPVAVYTADESLRGYVQSHRSRNLDLLFHAINPLGDGKVHALGWAGVALTGYLLKDDALYSLGKWGEVSFLITGITTLGLKVAIGRARPGVGKGATYFRPFSLDDDFNSLPSGHTSVAFSSAGYLFARSRNPWVRWGSLALATGVGAARIYLDRHWLSDVLLGAGLGFSIGYFVGRATVK